MAEFFAFLRASQRLFRPSFRIRAGEGRLHLLGGLSHPPVVRLLVSLHAPNAAFILRTGFGSHL